MVASGGDDPHPPNRCDTGRTSPRVHDNVAVKLAEVGQDNGRNGHSVNAEDGCQSCQQRKVQKACKLQGCNAKDSKTEQFDTNLHLNDRQVR